MTDIGKFTVCAVQPQLKRGCAEENFEEIKRFLKSAAAEVQIDLAVLPEHFPMWSDYQGLSSKNEKALLFLQGLAEDLNIYLIGGSFHRLDKSDNALYNTCHIIDRLGEIIGCYHKRKLFDKELKKHVKAGINNVVLEIEGWRVGVLICADLWYPELCREMMDKIDILCVPAESVVRNAEYIDYGRGLWHALALTRAQENAIVTVISDHAASNGNPCVSGGSSITDPSLGYDTDDLKIIRKTIPDGANGYLLTEIDRERLNSFRRYRVERGLLPIAGDG